jgi:dTDP-4-dehydrorhamnose reductase
MKKKILITGASGQLGQAFINLYKNKYNIAAFNRKSLDITNNDHVSRLIDSVEPDFVLNLAALTDVDLCETKQKEAFSINSSAIQNFKNHDVHFFQISTDYVFDGLSGPYKESDLTSPINIYGKSKLKGEEVVVQNFKNYTILRTNILFGLDSKASFLNWVIKNLKKNQKIKVIDDQFNNPISVLDCSRAISILIDSKISGLFHLGSDRICSRYDFAKSIATTWNLNQELINRISTKDLFNSVSSFTARRPLKSGLSTDFNYLPMYSLDDSLNELSSI